MALMLIWHHHFNLVRNVLNTDFGQFRIFCTETSLISLKFISVFSKQQYSKVFDLILHICFKLKSLYVFHILCYPIVFLFNYWSSHYCFLFDICMEGILTKKASYYNFNSKNIYEVITRWRNLRYDRLMSYGQIGRK